MFLTDVHLPTTRKGGPRGKVDQGLRLYTWVQKRNQGVCAPLNGGWKGTHKMSSCNQSKAVLPKKFLALEGQVGEKRRKKEAQLFDSTF